MVRHLEVLMARHAEISDQLVSEGYTAERAKELARLSPIAEAHSELQSSQREASELRELLGDGATDPELKELAQDELAEGEQLLAERQTRLLSLLVPADEADERNGAIVEVHAGVGGHEAGLFAEEMVEMYRKHAKRCGWRCEMLSQTFFDGGGTREAVFSVQGPRAYGTLRCESGVHRVQRVPTTETQGRVHTSTAVVMVLPEVQPADDVQLLDADVRVETFRSGGSGGQSVNTTDSAVRVTHLPTGMAVSCQDERSQHRNKDKAMQMLRAKILHHAEEQRQAELNAARGEQFTTGSRSERIRTYNFADDRVTDHRLNASKFGMPRMLGSAELLQELVEELHEQRSADRLASFLRQMGANGP